jgi:hypothetical protein
MTYAQRYILAVALKNAPSETSGGATGDYGDATTPAEAPAESAQAITPAMKSHVRTVGMFSALGGAAVAVGLMYAVLLLPD